MAEKCDKIIRKGSEHMLELNKPYKAEEIANGLFDVSYGTFRNNKEKYLKELSECYEWKYEKRKYVLLKEIKPYTPMTKAEKQYQKVYLPAVLNYVGNEMWTTGTGVTIAILNDEQVQELRHTMRTARSYVTQVLGSEYDITKKHYAACYGSGNYARLMTDEELQEWAGVKSKYSKETGQRIVDLTEEYAHGVIDGNEYAQEMKKFASSAYATALFEWMQKYGFVPVMINHYERKGIEFEENVMLE